VVSAGPVYTRKRIKCCGKTASLVHSATGVVTEADQTTGHRYTTEKFVGTINFKRKILANDTSTALVLHHQ